MSIEIPINVEVDVLTPSKIAAVKAVVNFLHLDFDNTRAFIKVSYFSADGTLVTKRFLKVSGSVYAALILEEVTGVLAEIVISRVLQFSQSLIQNPSIIDGKEVIEINDGIFLNDVTAADQT